MSPEVETIAGKGDNSFHLSLVKHAGKMKDNEVLSEDSVAALLHSGQFPV